MSKDHAATLDEDLSVRSVEEGVTPRPESGARPVNDFRRENLRRKKYKWRRMYKLAFDTLMTRFANFSDSEGSDESMDSDEELQEKIPKHPDENVPFEPASEIGKDPGEIEVTPSHDESDGSVNVSYRADFYQYLRHESRQEPRFERSMHDNKPIRITNAKDREENFEKSVFEITTMYAIRYKRGSYDSALYFPPSTILEPAGYGTPGHRNSLDGQSLDRNSQPMKVLADVGTYMTIRSKFVLDNLKDIIHYHPSLSLQAEWLTIQEPFCMLLHYRQELTERRDQLKQTASKSASPEEDSSSIAHEHLAYLTNFISQRYDDAISRETARYQDTPAMCTYDWVWLLFRPGSIVYAWEENVLRAHIVEDHDRRVGEQRDGRIRPKTLSNMDDVKRLPRPKRLKVVVWTLDFDGERCGRRRETYYIPAFDGEKPVLSLPIFPKEFLKYEKRVHQTLSTEDFLIQRGKLFFEMARKNYKEYDGESLTFPRRTIRGRVMIDTKAYYEDNRVRAPRFGLAFGRTKRERKGHEDPYYDSGESEYLGMRPRRYGEDSKLEDGDERPQGFTDRYEHYDDIDPYKCDSLEPGQYLICYYQIWVFVLKTRRWERLNVANIQQPDFQDDLIKDLVLSEDTKAIIKALSRRYTMQSETGVAWSADFIRNKGDGQIFLLHGKPGVGKTTTAECVAELTRRPLLSLTCGDLGVSPFDVEQKLMKWLKLATSWEAILLLDEADVYLESRISQDIQRNTLVSIFLRALEYYQGLMFLTTNRVGTFDDAFVSRIHVVIHYPDFTDDQRGQIWDIYFNKLERERENIKFTQRTVDYAKESKEMRSLGWNGREIRNAFNTAVGLAEYENERDGKQRVVFHARHLEQVVKMSRAFQDYLSSTHGMSQAEQARTFRTRNDYWKGLSEHGVGAGGAT